MARSVGADIQPIVCCHVDVTHTQTHADLTPPHTLVDLSDELVELVGRAVLVDSPRDACRFCQACRVLHIKLERLRARAMGATAVLAARPDGGA